MIQEMSVTEVLENDGNSSDSDIFIIKQIKPVKNHLCCHTAKSKNQVKNKKMKNNRINKKSDKTQEECPEKGSSQEPKNSLIEKSPIISNYDKTVSKNKQGKVKKKLKRNSSEEQTACTSVSVDKGSPEKITDCFTRSSSKESEENENVTENVQLSPGISKRIKRFKINDGASTSSKGGSSVKKSLLEAFKERKKEINVVNEDTDNCSMDISEDPILEFDIQSSLESADTLDERSIQNNSEYLSFILKNIINTELKKQNERKNLISEDGSILEKLLSRDEENILKNFLKLTTNPSSVLVRMLCRKKNWHRVSRLYLKGIKDSTKEFNILNKENFIDVNIQEENLETQLNLLSKPEILVLCRKFRVFSKSASSIKKPELISSLIHMKTNQKSVLEMFSKRKSNFRLNMLKSELQNCLGLCVKLNKAALSAFNKVIVLFSFAHYTDEESKRFSDQLFLCLRIFKNMTKFPKYKLSPCVVFERRADFEEYEKSLTLKHSFEIAKANKQFDDFADIAEQAESEFRRLLSDEEYITRLLRLKPFLRKFSGGTVYANILTGYCALPKTQTENAKIISIAELLLGQEVFLNRKRGQWYEALTKALERQEETDAAAEIVIKAIRDSFLNYVQKLTMQLRGQLILVKKINRLRDKELRKTLICKCASGIRDPRIIKIKGRPVQGNQKGYKSVYVEQNESGKVYSSVEEKAITYYKSDGYTRGFHVEGFIVHSMYFLFFYELIYELSPVGVFQTPYQKAPLDFYSSSFYTNRKHKIDLLLAQMLTWNDTEIEAKLNDVYNKNYDTTCLITWKDGFTPDLFCEVLKCLTMPIFVKICRRLSTNFAALRPGFPDLTLWNPETKKIKFVEVKSPRDRLSPAQRLWLEFLKNIGVDCEVCKVSNCYGTCFLDYSRRADDDDDDDDDDDL